MCRLITGQCAKNNDNSALSLKQDFHITNSKAQKISQTKGIKNVGANGWEGDCEALSSGYDVAVVPMSSAAMAAKPYVRQSPPASLQGERRRGFKVPLCSEGR